MFLLSDLQKVLVFAFLVTSMLSIGLRSGVAELRALFGSRGFLARAVVANFVLVPFLGLAIARVLPLPPETAGAIILLACLPGGLSAIHFTASVKGEETMAAALFVLMGLTAVLISPWVVRFVMPATAELDFPHGRVLGFVAISILAPICTGIVLHDHAPVFAPKLSRVLGFVSLVPFIAFTLVTRAFQKGAMHGLGGPAIAAILLFILASMAIGWLMGGPGLRSRQVLATVTSMRNTAVCLIIAKNAPLGDAALTPLIAFSLLMGTPNTVLALANAIWSRKSASRAKQRLEGAVPPAISSLEGRTR